MDHFIGKRELAARLQVNVGTLTYWVRRGKIPRPLADATGRVLWLRATIDEWLEQETTEDEDGLWTSAEIVAALGVSRETLRRWWTRGDFPKPLRIGRSLRWRSEDLRRWESRTIESAETS